MTGFCAGGVVAGFALATAASAGFDFGAVETLLVGDGPTSIAALDIDLDGDMDFVITLPGPPRVRVLVNGAGTFAIGQTLTIPGPTVPGDIVAGDFTGDGWPDVFVARPTANNVLLVRNLSGTLALGPFFAVGNLPAGLSAGDWNLDGDLDLAVANQLAGTVSALSNNGNGLSYSTQTLMVGPTVRHTAHADLDQDGDLDLAASIFDSGLISLFQRTAGGFSSMGVLPMGPPHQPTGLAAAPLSKDALVDLAAATTGAGLDSASVLVKAVGPIGAWHPVAHWPSSGAGTDSIAAGDLDCDGDVDLVTGNANSDTVSILLNLGDATFAPAQLVGVGALPRKVLAVDLEPDGDLDIASVEELGGTVTIVRSACGSPPITLSQLSWTQRGPTFVVTCRMLDAPAFAGSAGWWRSTRGVERDLAGVDRAPELRVASPRLRLPTPRPAPGGGTVGGRGE